MQSVLCNVSALSSVWFTIIQSRYSLSSLLIENIEVTSLTLCRFWFYYKQKIRELQATESIMFKITYNIKPAWRGTDAAGNQINSASSNKLGAKATATSKENLVEMLGHLDMEQVISAAKMALRKLDDEETSGGLQNHFLVTLTIQQPREEEEVTVTGGSRLDPNLIDEEETEED